jgi:hypothetical protein
VENKSYHCKSGGVLQKGLDLLDLREGVVIVSDKGSSISENYTRNEWRRCENYTQNEWRRCKSTLEKRVHFHLKALMIMWGREASVGTPI